MAAPYLNLAVPKSILDTDLYKFTMQQAVFHYFPDVHATYQFKNRNSNVLFSRQCFERFRAAVAEFTNLSLSSSEHEWMKQAFPFFSDSYLSYLAAYRYKPEQLQITFVPRTDDGLLGSIEIQASGPWVETICWEVPLMACLSETYFQTVATDWDYQGQSEGAFQKAEALLSAGCVFSEFGTRRRRSYQTQDIVIQSLIRASQSLPGQGKLAGTSNVHFAHKYNIPAIGTIAHEWFMGVAALKGYEQANVSALHLWENLYSDAALIALTDTFSTDVFFKDFVSDPDRVERWAGLRQDSGDPFAFAPRAISMYRAAGVDPQYKQIIFSDALDIEKCIRLQDQCNTLGLYKVSFGIGTFLTNDFRTLSSGRTEKSKALNIVIKLSSVDQKPCVKLSDDLTKNTGDKSTVEHVKRVYGLPV
ncbi:nicotinate phosphoribosyltransferase [Pluteus cervinus]|uniref:Nicotinate phosphoribosyltransferase n=1 Tax=Pluteus cervinus TaxID=181527 RepID=A0ACD3AY72_9AGAR|nr:nicotinate phosphoribosyltransferase [Pluteus cervinus]